MYVKRTIFTFLSDEIPSTAGLEDGIYIIKMYDNGRLKAQQNFLKD